MSRFLPYHSIDRFDKCLSFTVKDVKNESVEKSSGDSEYWVKCPSCYHLVICFIFKTFLRINNMMHRDKQEE